MRRVLAIVTVLLLLAGCGAVSARPEETEPTEYAEYDPWEECGHGVKTVVSAELVSQEKPFVFFQLMEEPKIEGIKVKLTYEDGSSEVVDAYYMKACSWAIDPGCDAGIMHLRGMYIDTRFYGWPRRPALKPGKHEIALFCVDLKYGWMADGDHHGPVFDSIHPEGLGIAYCMVEVYAQTGDEYISEHNLPFALVTESSGGDVTTQWEESKRESVGLIKLLAEKSGTYEIKIDGGFVREEAYCGSGAFKNEYDYENVKWVHYAQLNANEPMFLAVAASIISRVHVSMTRVPDGEVSWEE